MNKDIDKVIESISQSHKDHIDQHGRHYVEVSIGTAAEKLGFADMAEKYKTTWAIVPLKGPVSGMKVRIDGRTFVNYAQFDSGVAVPGYVAPDTGLAHHPYEAQHSMVLNCT
ncbi:MAG: hypothetical protein R6U41_10620 [Desulfosalsimonas sp.]|uniref:hypothetical protein n=1 Tax=Desulfosalsimonas sp. TaxID=3073848 RepID=UPI003970CF73